MMYKQCKLRRGSAWTTAWIEERGAKVGAHIELLSDDGQFWDVAEVYHYAMDEQTLRAKQNRDRNPFASLMVA